MRLLLAATALAGIVTTGIPQPAPAAGAAAPEGFRAVCGGCHELAVVTGHRDTPRGWRATVAMMAERGAPGSDADLAAITDYLIRRYGRIEINKASAADLQRDLHLPASQAAAIVAARLRHGPITDYAALLRIDGMSAATIAPYRESLIF